MGSRRKWLRTEGIMSKIILSSVLLSQGIVITRFRIALIFQTKLFSLASADQIKSIICDGVIEEIDATERIIIVSSQVRRLRVYEF